MTKNEFNNKWDNLMIFGTCGSPIYLFLNDNNEIHLECKICEDIKIIEIDRFIKMANDLKKIKIRKINNEN